MLTQICRKTKLHSPLINYQHLCLYCVQYYQCICTCISPILMCGKKFQLGADPIILRKYYFRSYRTIWIDAKMCFLQWKTVTWSQERGRWLSCSRKPKVWYLMFHRAIMKYIFTVSNISLLEFLTCDQQLSVKENPCTFYRVNRVTG